MQAQIEGYVLTYTSDAGSSGEIPLGRDMTSYRLVGLKPGAVYTIDIWAFRGDQVSRKSFTMVETGKLEILRTPKVSFRERYMAEFD